MPSDASLPIIDLTYRLILEVNRALGESPRSQRPGLERRGETAAFDLLEVLGAARHARGPEKQAQVARASQALDRLRLLLRMATDLTASPRLAPRSSPGWSARSGACSAAGGRAPRRRALDR